MTVTDTKNTRSIGLQAETAACEYLEQNTLTLVEKNYSSRHGEIDLIMLDKQTLVFIEVRYRKTQDFGGALLSISKKKQQKIRACALHYLQKNKLYEKQACRFDVLAMDADTIQWIKGAF